MFKLVRDFFWDNNEGFGLMMPLFQAQTVEGSN